MRNTRSSGKTWWMTSLSSLAEAEVAAERLLDDEPGAVGAGRTGSRPSMTSSNIAGGMAR